MKWWAIYTDLPVNAIVRHLHHQIGDSQDQETFLALSADGQTRNYDTRVLYIFANVFEDYIQKFQLSMLISIF